jgi:hypothetical protein
MRPIDLSEQIAMLHSADKRKVLEAREGLLKTAASPEGRTAVIRAVAEILDEPGVSDWEWGNAVSVLDSLKATDELMALPMKLGYPDGIPEGSERLYSASEPLAQMGESAVADLAAILSDGGVAARQVAAHTLGLIGEGPAEQALQRAQTLEKDTRVATYIKQALSYIDSNRRNELTDPTVAARVCISKDSERDLDFTARRIETVFLDGRPTKVNEILCHVAGEYVSSPGDWWLVSTAPSGVRASRIGRNPFFYSIGKILPSPDGRYLAVLSSAEGAPNLDVVDLPSLVRDKTWKPVGGLGLGLGDVSLKEWKGNTLEVASSMLFLGQKYGTYLLGAREEIFSWDVVANTVVPRSDALRDPVQYYCGFLKRREPYRSEAASALRRVNDRSAVPCVDAALKDFPNDSELKATLDQLTAPLTAQFSFPVDSEKLLIVSGVGSDRRLSWEDSSIAVPKDITRESIEAGWKNVALDSSRLRTAVAFQRKDGAFLVAFTKDKQSYRGIVSDVSRAEAANIAAIDGSRVYTRRNTVLEWHVRTGALVVRTEAWDATGKRFDATSVVKFDDASGLPVWP